MNRSRFRACFQLILITIVLVACARSRTDPFWEKGVDRIAGDSPFGMYRADWRYLGRWIGDRRFRFPVSLGAGQSSVWTVARPKCHNVFHGALFPRTPEWSHP
jgi:hypothetical protein